MDFNFALVVNSFPLLLEGALVTIKITALSVGFGLLIGLVSSIARMSKLWLVKMLASLYVDFIRGTPLLVQIFIIYFALPMITGVRVDPLVAAITACSINSGAYVAEIFRAGIESIDKGQMEAGRSLGLSRKQTMRSIIIPQAIRVILPGLGNEFISMIKESSIVSVVGIFDVMYTSNIIKASTYSIFEPLIVVALLYFFLTFTLTALMKQLEKRLSVYD